MLGAELLAAACRGRGVSCDVLYANLTFAALVGEQTHERVAIPRISRPVGEMVFAPEVFAGLPDPVEYLLTAEDAGPLHMQCDHSEEVRCYEACRAEAADFVEETAAAILGLEPRLVGFSAVCQQTLASLAVAKAIKARASEVLTVLGGPAASLPMGLALADVAPMLDSVVAGEADLFFAELCVAYLREGIRPPRMVDCGHMHDLDEAPRPDYSAYFAQLAVLQAAGSLPLRYPRHLLFESSRGCWWAEKTKCRFCGLIGCRYRRKSESRLLSELRGLHQRHAGVPLLAVDCIMPREMVRDVLPQLIADGIRTHLKYEIKADVSPQELRTLRESGCTWVQPGIESLCPSILRAFRKGVRATQGIRLLRECRSLGIAASWNFLYGVPGDELQDYRDVLRLLPTLTHLHAPVSYSSIALMRASPYHDELERYGFRDVRPLGAYRYLYPPEARMADIGTDYDADWPTALDEDPGLAEELRQALEAWTDLWRERQRRPHLMAVPLPGGRVLVQDTRPCAKQGVFLGDAGHAEALAFFDEPRTRSAAGAVPAAILAGLLERDFVVDWDGRYLSLVTRGAAERVSPAAHRTD